MDSELVLSNIIRDPVHDDIGLTDEELDIVDHRLFQRLRRCAQLPFVRLVFPGATHDRFGHSIGTMHLADQIYLRLKRNDVQERRLLRIAALLHDIAEPPYYPIFKESDVFAIDAPMRNFLEYAVREVCSSLKNPIDHEAILSILTGERNRRLLYQIIDSEVGANRLDYLLRDSHFCGVTYGKIDQRILFQFQEQEEELVLPKQAIPLVDTIFGALFQMKVNVYDHKIARGAFRLLQKSLENTLAKKSASLSGLIRLDDEQLLAKLEAYAPQDVTRLRSRELPRMAYCVYAYALREANGRKFGLAEQLESLRPNKDAVEAEVRRACNVSDVLLDFVQIRPTKSAPINVRINGDIVPIDRVPLLRKWYHEQPFEQWRLYIFSSESSRQRVSEVCDKIFGSLEVGREYEPAIKIDSLRPIYDALLGQRKSIELTEQIKGAILSLPDNEFETLRALVVVGRGTASDVGEKTGRSRATESLILNRLQVKRMIERRRMGRRIVFMPTNDIVPSVKSLVDAIAKSETSRRSFTTELAPVDRVRRPPRKTAEVAA